MEESVTRFINNNQSNESNSVEEENPLAFIASDYFLSSGQLLSGRRKRKCTRERQSPEKVKISKEDESINNSSDENMAGKIVTTKATLTLAKVCFVNLIVCLNIIFSTIFFYFVVN